MQTVGALGPSGVIGATELVLDDALAGLETAVTVFTVSQKQLSVPRSTV